MKMCLVIGGSGFIGKQLTRLLCDSGREVVVLGRRPEAPDGLHPSCRYISGNYSDRKLLNSLMHRGCEVIDLAYSTVPKTSYEDAMYDLLSNLPTCVGLFQEALQAGISRLLIVSSGGTVYGPAIQLPIREDHRTLPVSPYGITKLTTDLYASMFHRNAGLPVVIARPSNAYGEGQRVGTGQGFIAAAIDAVLSGREIEIYGVNGTTRDYIHVADVAKGLLTVLEQGEVGEVYNLGTGVGTSNSEIIRIIEMFAKIRDIPIRIKVLPSRRFDVGENVLDSTKLRERSGWVPLIGIQEGIGGIWNKAVNEKP